MNILRIFINSSGERRSNERESLCNYEEPGIIMDKQPNLETPIGEPIKSESRKRSSVIAYTIVTLLLALIAGTICIINILPFSNGILIKALQLLCFAGLGMIHISCLNRIHHFPGLKFPANNQLNFSFLLFLSVTIALLVLYAARDLNMLSMSLASGSSFLLPYIIKQAWNTYNRFPEKRFKVWYNSDVVMDSRTTVFLNSLSIRLQLSMRYFDIADEVFEATVPGHTQFGKFFNQFIIEKNRVNPSTIECVDSEKRPFGWQFYTRRFAGLSKRFIDPELSLIENNLKDHALITAKRVRGMEESGSVNNQLAEMKPLSQLNKTSSINKHEAGK